jgi:hypothetical protein
MGEERKRKKCKGRKVVKNDEERKEGSEKGKKREKICHYLLRSPELSMSSSANCVLKSSIWP